MNPLLNPSILDCADIMYDKAVNKSFKIKIEAVQYNASMVITGAIRETSRERLYHFPLFICKKFQALIMNTTLPDQI